ncbi:hypothetical protein KORDIASMS9_00802 [Kordia sp. SMS9]|nr:hypothetical protein KORDIASMS9_00802 [Kordia sp. SMS9]
MKNQQNFTQCKQFQVSSNLINMILGGEKKVIIKDDPEIE